MAVAAVVVLALVGVGLFAFGRDGGGSGNAARGSGDGADGGARVAPVRMTVSPRNGAAKVALDAKARVVADSGRLRRVRVTAAGGERLAGRLAEDGRTWVSTGPLAPAARYR
ncbi:MAG TPA: Ig-like domain-containing protein, partial [Actinomycetes bacterium]|nr:Ig-like domain-containing protein [Actinomycetes bacterium]